MYDQLTVITSNSNKFHSASVILKEFGITPIQKTLDIPEIQHEDSEAIVRDKAQKAFDIAKHPVVVTDDSWAIAGLKGFPGPYMKSMNHWLSAEDFLRLTLPLADRRIVLHQYLVYQDKKTQQLFSVTITGTLLTEIHGHSPGEPFASIVSLAEEGTSIAEMRANGKSAIAGKRTAWHHLGEWLTVQGLAP